MPDTQCSWWVIQNDSHFNGNWQDCQDPICACDTPVLDGCPEDAVDPVTQPPCIPDSVWAAFQTLVSNNNAGCNQFNGGAGFLRIHYLTPDEVTARGLGECGEVDNTEHCWCLLDADGDCHPTWGTEAQVNAIATANGWTVGEKDMPGDPCHNPQCWCIVDPSDATKCLQIVTMPYPEAAILASFSGTKAIPCTPDESSSAPESSTDEPQPNQGAGWLCVTDDSSGGDSSSGDAARGAGQLVDGAGVICKTTQHGTEPGCGCKPKTLPAELDVSATITLGVDAVGLDGTTVTCPSGTVLFSGTMRAVPGLVLDGTFSGGLGIGVGVPWTLGGCVYSGSGMGSEVCGFDVVASFALTFYVGGIYIADGMGGWIVFDSTPRFRAILGIAAGYETFGTSQSAGQSFYADLGPPPTLGTDPITGLPTLDTYDCSELFSSASWSSGLATNGTVSTPSVS